ncbi:DUF2797 domain-containing protein [Streptomyces sp. NPDC093085]|uniref:DUF2797 domain-containing protein n=1 Tax=Streptomyces sp. NPDC093085 TaxID=3155068 RepID=UPI00344112BB
MTWWCEGVRWGGGVPLVRWRRGREVRDRGLEYGGELGFRAVGGRGCVGARGNVCPVGAVVPGRSTGGRCAECARLERAHSVAADTLADDPRTYRVYLAWFGPGMVKVGITGERRGSARLLEQGAVVFSWLGRGPLMAARRTEEVVRRGLGVPDRVSYAEKRRVRLSLPGAGERAAEVEALHARALALEGWPQTLEAVAFEAVDHGRVFGVENLAPEAGAVQAVVELVDGGCLVGRVVAAAGPDLYVDVDAGAGAGAGAGGGRREEGGVVVLDTRLLGGWGLAAVPDARYGVTLPLVEVAAGGGDGRGGEGQGGLF